MTTFTAYILIPWLATAATALATAPLGNLICWRRLVYFGETVAHSALLGIALSLLLGLPPYIGIWCITLTIVILLHLLRRHTKSDGNTILGSLSHLALATGYILISRLENIRTDLMGYFFGDILATQAHDLVPIVLIVLITLITLVKLWQPLILVTLSPDIAKRPSPISSPHFSHQPNSFAARRSRALSILCSSLRSRSRVRSSRVNSSSWVARSFKSAVCRLHLSGG